MEALRESFDNNQREAMQNVYPPSLVSELLRDIHENLLAVKMWQVNKPVNLCDDCNQPLGSDRTTFAVNEKEVFVHIGEKVCSRCTLIRQQKLNHEIQYGLD